MPRVPTLDGPRVQLQPVGDIRQRISTDATMFGGGRGKVAAEQLAGVGKALETGGNSFMDIAVRVQARDDESSLLKFEKGLNSWEDSNLNDPQKGVYARKGEDVKGATRALRDSYDGSVAGMLEALPERLRAKAGTYSEQRRNRVMRSLSRYEESQVTAALVGQHTARIQESSEYAATRYRDPGAIAQSRAAIISSMSARAKLEGWTPEQRQFEQGNALSTMHIGIINRMLANKDSGRAQEYLSKYGDEVDGDDIAAVEKLVGAQVELQAVEDLVAGVYGKGSLTSIYDLIDGSGANPEVKAAARAAVKDRRSIELADQAAAKLQAIEAAVEHVVVNQKLIKDLPPEIIRQIGPHMMNTLRADEKRRRIGEEPVQSRAAWQEFQGMTKEQIIALDIDKDYGDKFDNRHYDAALTIQRAYRDAQAAEADATLSRQARAEAWKQSEAMKVAYQQVFVHKVPVDRLPKELLLKLPGSVITQLRAEEKRQANPIVGTQNWGKWTEFMGLSRDQIVALGADGVYSQYRADLDDAHFNQVMGAYIAYRDAAQAAKVTGATKAADKAEKNARKWDGTRTRLRMGEDLLKRLKIKPEKAEYGQFWAAFDAEVGEREGPEGKTLKEAEVRALMNKLAIVVTDGIDEEVFKEDPITGVPQQHMMELAARTAKGNETTRAAISKEWQRIAFGQIKRAHVERISRVLRAAKPPVKVTTATVRKLYVLGALKGEFDD